MGWKENDLFDMKIKNLMMSHQKISEFFQYKNIRRCHDGVILFYTSENFRSLKIFRFCF